MKVEEEEVPVKTEEEQERRSEMQEAQDLAPTGTEDEMKQLMNYFFMCSYFQPWMGYYYPPGSQ